MFGLPYAEEFGAWKAAIRDSRGRVQWSTVRKSLTNYLHDDRRNYEAVIARLMDKGVKRADNEARWEGAVEQEYTRILDRHLTILRRYARVVKTSARVQAKG